MIRLLKERGQMPSLCQTFLLFAVMLSIKRVRAMKDNSFLAGSLETCSYIDETSEGFCHRQDYKIVDIKDFLPARGFTSALVASVGEKENRLKLVVRH